MTKTLLITGGAGFIGSHFVRLILNETDYNVVNLDALTYAGKLENVADIANNPRYKFVQGSITDRKLVDELMGEVEAVVNFAAESHVDNSIVNPSVFVETNVLGTQTLLDSARKNNVNKFVQISTDEVYGDLALDDPRKFTETTPLAPNSPYSASKASADLLCRAAYETYCFPIVISRCSNNYGTHQLPEKLISLTIKNALAGKKIPVYGDGKNVRDWLHVTDHCRAILRILDAGKVGEIYNVGGNNEVENLTLVKLLLKIMGKPESLIEFVKDRLGHDRRYAIDAGKIGCELGWSPRETDFEKALTKVVNWYRNYV